ncbi:hypothetical protein BDV59DRAFT_167981 [Aspergillus ambiguus]|uniref:uncharacterized protein n=1 Tax=Aspergillus ambiguus TaxID=176160 RepID=UPI003CCD4ED9
MFSFFRGSKPTTPTGDETAPESSPQPIDPPTSTQSQPESDSYKRPSDVEIKILNPQSKYKLFFGGLAFFAFSLWSTRRALNRRYLASIPPYYTSSVYHRPDVSGGAEAFEALNLATLNVLSFGMAATGAALYAFDIDGVDDMRRYVRRGFESDGGQVTGTDVQLEQDIEQWVGSVLGKKFEDQLKKEKEGAVQGSPAGHDGK